jgi:hypothetical protein
LLLLTHFTVSALYGDFLTNLCGAVMVVMMTVMMLRGGKSRAGEHEDKEGSNDDLLHGKKSNMRPIVETTNGSNGIKTGKRHGATFRQNARGKLNSR